MSSKSFSWNGGKFTSGANTPSKPPDRGTSEFYFSGGSTSSLIDRYFDKFLPLKISGLYGVFILRLMLEQNKIWQDITRTTLSKQDNHPIRAMQCPFTGTIMNFTTGDSYALLKNDNGVWYFGYNGSIQPRFVFPNDLSGNVIDVLINGCHVTKYKTNSIYRTIPKLKPLGFIVYNRNLSNWEKKQLIKWVNQAETFNTVTSFTQVWQNSTAVELEYLNLSSGIDFDSTWNNCTALTSFPAIDLSNGIVFDNTWNNCYSLTSFPAIDLSNGTDFSSAWGNCTSLTSFPASMFDNCNCYDYSFAWYECALDETSVDNILVSIALAATNLSLSGGTIHLNGGTNATPGSAGLTAKSVLEGFGWTISHN